MNIPDFLKAVVAPFRPSSAAPLRSMTDEDLTAHIATCEARIADGEAAVQSASAQLAEAAAEAFADGESTVVTKSVAAIDKARASLEGLRVTLRGLRVEQKRRATVADTIALQAWADDVTQRGEDSVRALERWNAWAKQCPIEDVMEAFNGFVQCARDPRRDVVLRRLLDENQARRAWDATGLERLRRELSDRLMLDLYHASGGRFGRVDIGTTVHTFLESHPRFADVFAAELASFNENAAPLVASSTPAPQGA